MKTQTHQLKTHICIDGTFKICYTMESFIWVLEQNLVINFIDISITKPFCAINQYGVAISLILVRYDSNTHYASANRHRNLITLCWTVKSIWISRTQTFWNCYLNSQYSITIIMSTSFSTIIKHEWFCLQFYEVI